jgi:hypothetical protein
VRSISLGDISCAFWRSSDFRKVIEAIIASMISAFRRTSKDLLSDVGTRIEKVVRR